MGCATKAFLGRGPGRLGGHRGGQEPPEHHQEMGTPRCHPSGGPVPAACQRLSTFPALAAPSSGHVPSNPISSSRFDTEPRAPSTPVSN